MSRIQDSHYKSTIIMALSLALIAAQAFADEVRPAYLELNAQSDNSFNIVWKQPVVENRRLPIDPIFPRDCELHETSPPELTGTALLKRWQTNCDLSQADIEIVGLRTSITDVMVRYIKADGTINSYMVQPEDPVLRLGSGSDTAARQRQHRLGWLPNDRYRTSDWRHRSRAFRHRLGAVYSFALDAAQNHYGLYVSPQHHPRFVDSRHRLIAASTGGSRDRSIRSLSRAGAGSARGATLRIDALQSMAHGLCLRPFAWLRFRWCAARNWPAGRCFVQQSLTVQRRH